MSPRDALRTLLFIVGVLAPVGCHSPGSPSSAETGQIQIIASWDSVADVDLHVVEPSGTEIYWGNMGPTTSGGTLDMDANDDCRVNTGSAKETIQWTSNAPKGAYIVRLDYYNSCKVAQTTYSVTINNGGTTLPPVSGTFTGDGDVGSLGSGRPIAAFTH